MAPPTLRNVVGASAFATSISIPANYASPVSNDYRVLVVHTGDTMSSGQPVTVATPNGWTLLHATPRGRFWMRTWVFGQTWTNSTPASNVTFNANLAYSIACISVANTTKPPWTALITNPPLFGYARSGTAIAESLAVQADSMRFDFWANYYNTGADNASNTISVPTGQTGSTTWRPSATTNGFVARVTYETILTKQSTGERIATGVNPYTSQVLSLAIGGWTTYSKATTSTMGLTKFGGTASKHVTRNTATTMALAGTSLGSGRAATGETSTELALTNTAQRVYLTSTVLGLQNSVTGEHHVAEANSIDDVGLVSTVDGHHVNNPVNTTTELGLTEVAVGRVGGGGAPASIVDPYTAQYVPPLRPLRFMFQDIRRGTWLNWDVAIVDPEITWTLSGPTTIRGKVGPEDIEVIRGIDAWGTWLHVEESGLIRASAIVQPLSIQGDDLMIEAVGVHGFAIGQQFEGEFSAVQIDAAEAMRQLWVYLQQPADAKLGVTLDPTNTGRLLGEPARIEFEIDANTGAYVYEELRLETDPGFEGLYMVVVDEVPAYVVFNLLSLNIYDVYQNTETGAYVLLVTPMDYSMAATGLPAVMQVDPETGEQVWYAPKHKYIAAKPYEIAWWNGVDCGREIENLCKQTPFDFAEQPRWAGDQLAVDQHIAIGWPRLGTKRHDLRFAEDENLFAAVLLRETPSFYASQVIVRGAGEGRAAVRGQFGGNHSGRVRRVASITDQTITTRARAEALARDELYRRLAAYTISEITIDATHDNAPMGSFALGDDILVQANLPYYGEVQLWHRITAYSWYPDRNEVKLSLRRSEQFNYGRVLPN